MGFDTLASQLPRAGLGLPLHFYSSLPSTNDLAKELADGGAGHGTLVVADEQTAGRGRFERSWYTPAGSALALSLVLRPQGTAGLPLGRLAGLGPLAVAAAVEAEGGLPAIKWPNDLLLSGHKAAGTLVELSWNQDQLDYVVLGIGVNVHPESVPPAADLLFPATCLDLELGRRLDRQQLLLRILDGVSRWLQRLVEDEFVRAWDKRLAFKGEAVRLETEHGAAVGILHGLDSSGQLRLEDSSGNPLRIHGEVLQLRPVDSGTGSSKLAGG